MTDALDYDPLLAYAARLGRDEDAAYLAQHGRYIDEIAGDGTAALIAAARNGDESAATAACARIAPSTTFTVVPASDGSSTVSFHTDQASVRGIISKKGLNGQSLRILAAVRVYELRGLNIALGSQAA